MPLDAEYGPPPQIVQVNLEVQAYLDDLLRDIRAAYERAGANSRRAAGASACRYDAMKRLREHRPGEKVLVLDFRASVGEKSRPGLYFKGPWTVVEAGGPKSKGTIYEVKGEDGKVGVLHHNNLKPCISSREESGFARPSSAGFKVFVNEGNLGPGGGNRARAMNPLFIFLGSGRAAEGPGCAAETRVDHGPKHGPPTPVQHAVRASIAAHPCL